MNFFLQTRNDIDLATKAMEDAGMVCSGISAKNWEIFQILPYMKDGNLLDMGSDGSVVIANAIKKEIKGTKVGIDLAYPEDIVSIDKGVDLLKGDLCNVPFPDGFFNFISSLSVLEHEVDFVKFAKECSRLLAKGAHLFVSFDYAPEKIDTSLTRLYSLSWNILSRQDAERFVLICGEHGLVISGEIDWTTKDMVINDQYCSPAKNVSYTFGIFEFIKQ